MKRILWTHLHCNNICIGQILNSVEQHSGGQRILVFVSSYWPFLPNQTCLPLFTGLYEACLLYSPNMHFTWLIYCCNFIVIVVILLVSMRSVLFFLIWNVLSHCRTRLSIPSFAYPQTVNQINAFFFCSLRINRCYGYRYLCAIWFFHPLQCWSYHCQQLQ